MAQWGGNANTASKPTWGYLTNSRIANAANLVANSQGWMLEHPSGIKEVIVASGNLSGNAPTLRIVALEQINPLVNSADQILSARIRLSHGVTVANTQTIVAISSNASHANITMTLSLTDSDPATGDLIFKSANTNLSAYAANTKLVLNSTSSMVQTGNVKMREFATLVLPSTIPAALSLSMNVASA